MLRALEDSSKIPAVARQGSRIGADYRLVMDIRHFEADYAGAATPSGAGRGQRQAAAYDRPVGDRHPHDPPGGAADGTEVARVADAFGRALQATSREIAGWVLRPARPTSAPTRPGDEARAARCGAA